MAEVIRSVPLAKLAGEYIERLWAVMVGKGLSVPAASGVTCAGCRLSSPSRAWYGPDMGLRADVGEPVGVGRCTRPHRGNDLDVDRAPGGMG